MLLGASYFVVAIERDWVWLCSWLEDLNRRHAEIVASRMSADKMRQRDQELSTENEALKVLVTTSQLSSWMIRMSDL